MIKIVQTLENNYSYIITYRDYATVIDPGEFEPVNKALISCDIKNIEILLTHNHYDHIDGAKELKKVYGVKVINHKEYLKIDTPGHTKDSCCFYFPKLKALFTGDTLFTGLCGRLFEGDYREFHNSLQTLAQLPDETIIYPGHEYLNYSIEFLDSQGLDSSYYKSLLDKNFPSTNTTLGAEKLNNPFMVKDFDDFKYLRVLKG